MRKILLICGLFFSVCSYADDYKYIYTDSQGAKVYLNTNPSYIQQSYKKTYSLYDKTPMVYTVWIKYISRNETTKENLMIDTKAHQYCPISSRSSIPKNSFSNNCDSVRWGNYDSEMGYALIGNRLDQLAAKNESVKTHDDTLTTTTKNIVSSDPHPYTFVSSVSSDPHPYTFGN